MSLDKHLFPLKYNKSSSFSASKVRFRSIVVNHQSFLCPVHQVSATGIWADLNCVSSLGRRKTFPRCQASRQGLP